MLHFLYTSHSIKLSVKFTVTPPTHLKFHSFIVILLSLIVFILISALCNLAIQATETKNIDLI